MAELPGTAKSGLLREAVTLSRVRACVVLLVSGLASPALACGLVVEQMTTNGRTNPLGIAADDLSLSWAIRAETRGVVQTAYRIRVGAVEGGDDVWDSGRIVSGKQIDIALPRELRLSPSTRYYWQVMIWDDAGVASRWSSPAWFETGLLSASDWSGAKWIAPRSRTVAVTTASVRSDRSETVAPLPLLRGTIDLPKEVKHARLYASARGLYQLSINGCKVGDQHLAPGWTDYCKRIQAQTYDVTPLLEKGVNVIGAALGDGWYRGKVGIGWRNVYGDALAFVAMLHVTYADESEETLVSDGGWRTSEGPFVQADLQDGETFDARREQVSWDRKEFDASAWLPADVLSDDLSEIVPQPDEPVRLLRALTAQNRTSPAPGVYVYDLG